MITVHL